MYDDSEIGKITEKVMRIFWPDGAIPLGTQQYNQVWSHVNNVLRESGKGKDNG